MFDLHALYNATGYQESSALLTSNLTVNANIPTGDGAPVAGVPIAPGAVLKYWGLLETIADTIFRAQMWSQDMFDAPNGEAWNPGANSTVGLVNFEENLPYVKGARNIGYSQNTAAAKVIGYTIDQYSDPSSAPRANNPGTILGQHGIYPQVFGGALTAGAWGTIGFAPAAGVVQGASAAATVTLPPAGRYAILGAYVHGLTNYALIRFEHADFGGFRPGFPAVDASLAVARAVAPMNDSIFNLYGRQFVAMGDIPTCRFTAGGTGLTIDAIAVTADTPNVIVNLAQVMPTSKS